jgi:hypothetical protein
MKPNILESWRKKRNQRAVEKLSRIPPAVGIKAAGRLNRLNKQIEKSGMTPWAAEIAVRGLKDDEHLLMSQTRAGGEIRDAQEKMAKLSPSAKERLTGIIQARTVAVEKGDRRREELARQGVSFQDKLNIRKYESDPLQPSRRKRRLQQKVYSMLNRASQTGSFVTPSEMEPFTPEKQN